ncbi:DUF4412 domain-containing protein [Lacinutrix sp. C3R15]|uniref:DUF4412 domain-containing protein n=1 Tax=Flavobacteriaceae TaxID=49546 RepID=UPI001C07F81A|nr:MULTISPECIES: DUF4412 domain-containing protein [Flavobacteriaceae]MBU2939423.1 DUF4412 domain-containing protein [Lacinutrix sp. C3R15]MDO6622738.1 DUF4412 domain-containing protein [Oceanihabitans sp. 1_MG-2023]
MKLLKLTLIALCICITTNMQAQLLKKLGKTAERAVERTLDKKVDKKTTKETEKTFDSTFNNTKSSTKEKGQVSNNSNYTTQETYSFTHKYVMQIEGKKHATTINYFLNNDANYIGSSIDLENNPTSMLTVMNMTNKTATMFMDMNNQKSQMSIALDLESMTDESIEDQQVKITPTEKTKTILNFTCHEYKVEGKDYYGNIWVTQDAGVSFSKSFYKTKSKQGLNQSWMAMVNGLTMEMHITNTSKRKEENIVMKCIALEKSNLIIKSSDYKKMM